jgi:hypothetical protein
VQVAWVAVFAVGCSFSGSGASIIDGAPAVGIDAGADARERPVGACGKAGAVWDDFADGLTAAQWIVIRPGQIQESAAGLRIAPLDGAIDTYSGYLSDPAVDLRDAAVEVEVASMVAAGQAYFLLANGAEWFGIAATATQLVLGVQGIGVSVTYDPGAHRFWRIEEAGGVVRFLASADALSWTELHTMATPAYARAARIGLGVTNTTGATSPGAVTFRGLNVAVPSAAWCAAATFTDPFDGFSLGYDWVEHGHTTPACGEGAGFGAAHVDQYGGGACDTWIGTSTLFDLTGSSVGARIPTIGTFADGWIAYLAVRDLTDQFVRLYFSNGQMCGDATGHAPVCRGYNGAHDYWRIREAAGVMYWETSSNQTAWAEVHSMPVPFALTAVRSYLGTAADRDLGGGITLSIDTYNP